MSTLAPQKQKGPSEANMSNLKSALADVLKDQNKPRIESQTQARPVPSAPQREVPKSQNQKPEEKAPEQSPQPREEVKKEVPSPPTKPEEPRGPREVPEDVLTAILRGED